MRGSQVKALRREVFQRMNYDSSTDIRKVMKTHKFRQIFRARKKNYTRGVTN